MDVELDRGFEAQHLVVVRLRSVGSSPLAVVAVALAGGSLWTCAYESATGQANDGTAVAATGSGSVAAVGAERGPAPAAVERQPGAGATERAEGPRLRHEPEPDQLGLPIAIEDKNGRALENFHKALERAAAGEGQARLVFFGASHVASDLFTGRVLRRQLQQRYGDAGHGFVLPVHPWRTYRHYGVEVESARRRWETLRVYAGSGDDDYDHYGLAGVAVETDRAGAWGEVRTAESGRVGRKAGLFDVFYLEQPGGGDFDVYVDGRRVKRVETAASESQPGYALIRVEDGAHRLRIRARGNGKVRIFGVAVERERPGVMVDTLGINGARARYHLLWDDALYREHLKRRDPDLVALAYGTNESGDDRPIADYEADLRKVVGRIRETVPHASCLLIGPSDRPVRVPNPAEDEPPFRDRPRTAKVNAVQRRVALDLGCGYFDLVAFQGGPLSMVEWAAHEPPYGASDHIHYTVRGYTRLGEELLGALVDGFTPADAASEDEAVAAQERADADEG